MMKSLSRTLAIALEAVGCSAIMAGISVECIMRADLGFIIITSGSLIVAIGGVVFAKFVKLEK